MSSIVPLSRSPYRAPGTGIQRRVKGEPTGRMRSTAEGEHRTGAELSAAALEQLRPVAGCVAWAETTGARASSRGETPRQSATPGAPGWARARRREGPARARNAAVSEAMRAVSWPATARSAKADRPVGHRHISPVPETRKAATLLGRGRASSGHARSRARATQPR